VAFAHVDDAVARLGVEAEQHLLAAPLRPQRGAAAAVGRRDVGGQDVGRGMPCAASAAAIRSTRKRGKLSSSSCWSWQPPHSGKWRHGGTCRCGPGVIAAVGQHHIAGRGQRKEAAALRDAVAAAARRTMARPWSQTPAQAASKASRPEARMAAMMPARTSPVPAVASQLDTAG
jgi:hypothetical protein